MVCLPGADPTLLGGGELALDIDVDVIETLSETISLTGVPRRDGCLSTTGEEAIPATAGGSMRGLFSFGVGNTRIVRGWTVRGAGDPVRETAVLGVPGREIAPWPNSDDRSVLSGVSGFVESSWYPTDCKAFLDASCAAVISSLPGCCRFSTCLVGASGSAFCFTLRASGALFSGGISSKEAEVDDPLPCGEPEASTIALLLATLDVSSCTEGPALEVLESTVIGTNGLTSLIGVATRDGVLGRTGTTGGRILDATPEDWALPGNRAGVTGTGRGAIKGGKSCGCESPGGAGIEIAEESSSRMPLTAAEWGASEAASLTRLSTELIASFSWVELSFSVKSPS